MVTLFFATALGLYLAATGSLAISFAGGRAAVPRAGTALVAAGVALHAAGLVAFVATHAELPLVGLGPSLCTMAFFIALSLLIATVTSESRPVALVLLPLTAVLVGIALALGVAPAEEALAFRGAWFSLHVLLAFAGYAGLTIAFAAGLLYLLQFRELKDRRLGRVFRFFPALPTLDRLGRYGLAIGFPSLTVALLLGWAWTVRFRQTFAPENPQVIWGVITWFAFAVVLAVRSRAGADAERRAAWAGVAGFVFVVLSYLVLRLTVSGSEGFL